MIALQEGICALLAKKKKPHPTHVNRISALDDPCSRRLYYLRAAWDKIAPRDDRFQGILETGSELEGVIERIIQQAGEVAEPKFRIIGQQTTTNDNLLKEHQISGTIDGFLQIHTDGLWTTVSVVDIKTSDPNIYHNLVDYDSLGRYSWTRKYRGQLMLYALAHNVEQCAIIFVNKSNLYDQRVVSFGLDYNYCESLIQKADEINAAIELSLPPDKINDPDECPRCAFAAICCPDYKTGGNLKAIDDDELIGVLDCLDQLHTVAAEIRELEKQRDKILAGHQGESLLVGNYLVTWKKIEGNRKPSEGGPYTQWRKKIVHTT